MNIKDSQNFLHNKQLVVELIQKCCLSKEDVVLEIGPGKGIITNELCNNAKKVIAIEYDENLYRSLKEKNSNTNLELIHCDFLKYNLPSYKYKVVSNIPFNITTEIISKLLENENPPQEAFLVMQAEAMQKFSGGGYYLFKNLNV